MIRCACVKALPLAEVSHSKAACSRWRPSSGRVVVEARGGSEAPADAVAVTEADTEPPVRSPAAAAAVAAADREV